MHGQQNIKSSKRVPQSNANRYNQRVQWGWSATAEANDLYDAFLLEKLTVTILV